MQCIREFVICLSYKNRNLHLLQIVQAEQKGEFTNKKGKNASWADYSNSFPRHIFHWVSGTFRFRSSFLLLRGISEMKGYMELELKGLKLISEEFWKYFHSKLSLIRYLLEVIQLYPIRTGVFLGQSWTGWGGAVRDCSGVKSLPIFFISPFKKFVIIWILRLTCCWEKSINLSKKFSLTTLASEFWWLSCLGRKTKIQFFTASCMVV